ncbi:hypothetical protein BD626DRAFT_512390 [Schizophyllum amplum]|uniref:Uncharacterized protein n=1 Tax=Schizophyllum amplum TaxID=97359 RepID=A0A550C039_9AGAR|nr:hypothetical protein BD626DRAFT_512390 [Auriculariopsis ampla]
MPRHSPTAIILSRIPRVEMGEQVRTRQWRPARRPRRDGDCCIVSMAASMGRLILCGGQGRERREGQGNERERRETEKTGHHDDRGRTGDARRSAFYIRHAMICSCRVRSSASALNSKSNGGRVSGPGRSESEYRAGMRSQGYTVCPQERATSLLREQNTWKA